jgi:hypothetical protein
MSAIELIERAQARPDEWAGWLAVAEWLRAAGDPRGTLLALEHQVVSGGTAQERIDAQERVDALLAAHEDAWALDREEPGWSYYLRTQHLALLRRARLGWNRGRDDRFATLAAGPALHLYVAPQASGTDRPLTAHYQRLIEAAIARIDAAFDGRPPPGEGQRTLYQAEAADNSSSEVPDRAGDHAGRWQEIPPQQLLDNQWALAHLDAEALRYYLPAFMTFALRNRWSELRCGPLIDNTSSLILPGRSDDSRQHRRKYLSRLVRSERVAICTFAAAMGDGRAFDAWIRVVEAERDDASAPWFDAFWPDRPRPELELVRGAFLEAFADVRGPVGWVEAPWQELALEVAHKLAIDLDLGRDELPGSNAERLLQTLPALMKAVLDGRDEERGRLAGTIDDLLHPDLRPRERERVARRFVLLDRRQRAAIDLFLRRYSRRQSVRERWQRIATLEHETERADWCELLFEPWDGPGAYGG